ncbi:MAG: proline racemase family protein [Phyllobacterium sp.]
MFVKNVINYIDHHHGQASRTVLSGYPAIRGATMREKEASYLKSMPWVHEALLREPRGHRNLLGAILTDPVSSESAYGVLFLHPSGLFDGCGDSTLSTASALIETGMVEASEPVTRFQLDTVLGPLGIEADVKDGVVTQVRFRNVPSYHVGDIDVDLPDGRHVHVELAFGGLTYGFIDAQALGIVLQQSSEAEIVATAQALWAKIGDTTELTDPVTGRPARIDLFTFVQREEAEKGSKYRAANVYRPGRMGRTPSGTGSSAHIALRVAKGLHEPSEPFVQESLLGLHFVGTAERSKTVNGHDCVLPSIGAKSFMMGMGSAVIDPEDPFRRGFIVEG